MKYNFISAIVTTAFLWLSGCCVISIPTPQLTGEKTAIERQIIGEYRELESDAWVVSSVKTNIQRGEKSEFRAGSDLQLLKAIKTREFQSGKIRGYKDEGAIGEKNDGLIAYRSVSKYDQSKDQKTILQRVIDDENSARRVIFERTLIRTGIHNPGEKELSAFGKIFAEEQRALAARNDWIQDETGGWISKK